ncbi:hypothetical protein ASE67_02715 [Sphingomonas sp. Leaf23]|uniref:hypothetical protein n=1 Tax=Sphingomonas sp. Leaf23 TaxID=1735689 RepID=UPI0006FE783B|nr:hypothetical protein [Sphingomonas sp. Leaf23]KQM88672.1 hypothetical protein ASE67_02715 [Sphingomonas sp. Leaf23]
MTGLKLPDARGWIGIGVFLLTVMVFAMTAAVPALRDNEYFKTLGTLVVGAFIKDVVSWAYAATKGGGELAEQNATIVRKQAESSPPITGE